MKRSIFLTIWTAFLTVIFFTGCNLYLDEDNTPQEEKGYDAPVHIKTDTLEMTYQFNEGVKQLTKNVQQYLEKVEADTILYFNTGTPHDYLPLPGGYVCAELSEKLPTGLMGYVLSVQNEDGYIRVVTTAAGLKEIFKVLKVEVEKPVNYDHCYVLPDTTVNDSTIFVSNDTTSYLYVPDDEPLLSKPTYWETRNENEEDKDEIQDGNYDDDPETTSWTISLDTRNLPSYEQGVELADCIGDLIKIPKVPNALKGLCKFANGKPGKNNTFKLLGPKGIETFKNFYAAMSYERTNKQTVRCVIDTEKEELEYWTKDETTHTVTVEGGFYGAGKVQRQPGEWLVKKKGGFGRLMLSQTIDGPEIYVPCFTWGGIVVSTGIDIEAEAKICGVGKYTHKTVKKTGARYVGGVLETIDEKPPTTTNKVDFEYAGSAKLEASFHIDAGVRIGKGLTLDLMIGGFITTGVELKYTFDLDELAIGNNHITDDTYFRFYVDIGPRLRFRAKFHTYSLLDETIPILVFHPVNAKWTLFPSVDTKTMKVTRDEDFLDEDDMYKTRFDMTMKYSPGILVKYLNRTMSPFVRIYEGDKVIKDQLIPKEATSSLWPIQADGNFVYHYSLDDLYEDVLYYAVPCFVYNNQIYEQSDDAYYFTASNPYIYLKNGIGDKMQVYYQDWGKKKSYYYVLQPVVAGASKMKKWGIHITIKNSKGKKVYNKLLPVNLARSKVYTLGIEFETAMENMEISFEPYAEIYQPNGTVQKKYFSDETYTSHPVKTLGSDMHRDNWYSYSFDKQLTPDVN